jgi:hypothetical protein
VLWKVSENHSGTKKVSCSVVLQSILTMMLLLLRAGYLQNLLNRVARQYATVGVGLKYASFGLDLSILINTSKINTALDNTLRFGLTWNIGSETYNAQDY